MIMSDVVNNKGIRRQLFAEQEYRRFEQVRDGTVRSDYKLVDLWVEHQVEHGQIEISVRSGGGFQIEILPKGGFLADDHANLCDAFAATFCPGEPTASQVSEERRRQLAQWRRERREQERQ